MGEPCQETVSWSSLSNRGSLGLIHRQADSNMIFFQFHSPVPSTQ